MPIHRSRQHACNAFHASLPANRRCHAVRDTLPSIFTDFRLLMPDFAAISALMLPMLMRAAAAIVDAYAADDADDARDIFRYAYAMPARYYFRHAVSLCRFFDSADDAIFRLMPFFAIFRRFISVSIYASFFISMPC